MKLVKNMDVSDAELAWHLTNPKTQINKQKVNSTFKNDIYCMSKAADIKSTKLVGARIWIKLVFNVYCICKLLTARFINQ